MWHKSMSNSRACITELVMQERRRPALCAGCERHSGSLHERVPPRLLFGRNKVMLEDVTRRYSSVGVNTEARGGLVGGDYSLQWWKMRKKLSGEVKDGSCGGLARLHRRPSTGAQPLHTSSPYSRSIASTADRRAAVKMVSFTVE